MLFVPLSSCNTECFWRSLSGGGLHLVNSLRNGLRDGLRDCLNGSTLRCCITLTLCLPSTTRFNHYHRMHIPGPKEPGLDSPRGFTLPANPGHCARDDFHILEPQGMIQTKLDSKWLHTPQKMRHGHATSDWPLPLLLKQNSGVMSYIAVHTTNR